MLEHIIPTLLNVTRATRYQRGTSVTANEITVDGVTVALDWYNRACALADATRRTYFIGRIWELDSERPGYHRDTDRHVISDSREVMKQFCGSWQGVPPMKGGAL